MHTSVNSYVPELSVKDIPTGAYIQQSIDGFWARHESALPKETVPDGHVVAIVISGVSIVMYSDGHLKTDTRILLAQRLSVQVPNI